MKRTSSSERMKARRRAGGLGLMLCLLWPAAPAVAGPPGKWTRVTSEAQPSNTSEVGLERTADGVLHVLWRRDSGATEEVMHTSISANARTLSDVHQLISTGNAINPSVDLVGAPGGGIRALFSGIFPASPRPGGFSDVMATATSTTGGASWSGVVAASNSQVPGGSPVYVASGIGAAVADGTVISIWGDSSPSGAGFHLGLDPATPDGKLSPSVGERDPGVGIDSVTGEVVLGWNFLGSGAAPNSLQVSRPGSGTVTNAPGSGAVWLGQRIGLSGRIGAGGVYAAYGAGTNTFNARPALWRVGDAKARAVKQPRDAEHTTLAPAPAGRVWVAWEGSDRGKRIFATRTNPAATAFGEVVSIAPPKGTDAIHSLSIEGSPGFLDVIALVDRGGGDLAHWHRRLLPGLTLSAKPRKVAAGKAIAFKVTDAAAPVAKAKVTLKLGKKKVSAKTKANGRAKLKVPSGTKRGRYAATARRAGYTPGKLTIRVR
jgi:hypothetical protein